VASVSCSGASHPVTDRELARLSTRRDDDPGAGIPHRDWLFQPLKRGLNCVDDPLAPDLGEDLPDKIWSAVRLG
jgi:hypothetical protein